ncbi:MAG: RNA polymerase sigma factor [Sphingobacteriales bacterium]
MSSKPNDRILLAAVAADDQAAYKTLFESYYDRLYRLALLVTRSNELSEEIVSDVFIALWRNRANALEIGNLRVYLYIATRNTALNYQKTLQKKMVVRLDDLEIDLADPYVNPEQAFITREMDARIRAAIDALPPRCKMVFKLVKEDGLSYKEAAEVLGLSVGTVDNQLVIAIKKIASALFYRFSPLSGK